ncbi:MAG: alpha/beta fold hydrolase [Acidimicrobiales bacterium]
MRWTRRRFLGVGAGALAVAACSDEPGGGATDDSTVETVRYGDEAPQHLELTRPADVAVPPVVVLVHGGFWSAQYDLTLMQPLVPSLVGEGWAVANIEYRSVPVRGSGWPGTFEDAAAAVDVLAAQDGLDLTRVIALGHSAGGHLAVWLASRGRLPEGAPGRDPKVVLTGAISQAGVLDLVAGADQRLGGGAVQSLLGGDPAAVPDRYSAGSPSALVPIGVPVELFHGSADRHVPIDQSRRYAGAALTAGDPVTFTEVPGDHFAIIDPTTEAWAACVVAARRLLA